MQCMNVTILSGTHRFLRVLVLCLIASGAVAQSLQVIELRYRTAQEVIPVLQPLVESGGALSGSDYKLFVRASAGNVAELRRVLAQLDQPPRQLLIAVRRATRQSIEREELSGSAAISNRGMTGSISTSDSAVRKQDDDVASVQVIEGGSAYIATGSSVPVVTSIAAGGRRPWLAASTTYRDINSGFLVTPRVPGTQVNLSIEQQAQRTCTVQGAVDTQSITTQVVGQLHRWISLGGVQESSAVHASDIAGRQYATRSDDLEVWVRVTER
jgi:type II secretory pathway component GspD/PulD (secretin)